MADEKGDVSVDQGHILAKTILSGPVQNWKGHLYPSNKTY